MSFDELDSVQNSVPRTLKTRERGSVVDDLTFVTRPLQIYHTTWQQGTILNDFIDPWSLFLNNKRVVNRITNQYLMKSNLCLKFMINGNVFFYGRIMAGYIPLWFNDYATAITSSWFDNIQLSQCPKIFLDPTTSQGGCMKIPFMYYKDYANIVDGDYSELGRIFIREIVPLYHANEVLSTENIDITVYAWLEESTFAVPTAEGAAGLVAQSSDEYDEKCGGKISGPATTVAKVASALSNVPVLAPYAKATEVAANTVGKAAKMFGLSAPSEVTSPDTVIPRTAQSFSTTDQVMRTNKLTLDSKQELAISPTVAGLGTEDPLSLSSIASKETLLYSFPWSQAATNNTLVYNWLVTPSVCRTATHGGKLALHMPAIAGVMLPFTLWSGSITYRIQIVASGHHRGRLALAYDPCGTNNTFEVNTLETEVVDIADSRDFEITISNCQSYGMLRKNPMPVAANTESLLHGTSAKANLVGCNGSLAIWVVNQLTTPNPASTFADAYINVYVKAGPDFSVGEPSNDASFLVFKPQSSDEMYESDDVQPEGADTLLKVGTPENTELHSTYCGETVASFRQLIKRFQYYESRSFTNPARNAYSTHSLSRPYFPKYRGNVAGATELTSTAAPYNYCATTLLNYITMAFQGFRGSIRHRMIIRPLYFITEYNGVSPWTVPVNNATAAVYRIHTGDNLLYTQGTTNLDLVGSTSSVFTQKSVESAKGYNSQPGCALTDLRVNTTLEFEVPFYNRHRFVPGKPIDWTAVNTEYGGYYVEIEGAISACSTDDYVAAGEDFTVFFFTGWPRVYYESSAPAA